MTMTLTNEFKILDYKIKTNQANMIQIKKQLIFLHYHLVNQKKNEYLTGENLVYKLRVVEKAKFEYYSLSKVFNKGLKEENKEEGLLQR